MSYKVILDIDNGVIDINGEKNSYRNIKKKISKSKIEIEILKAYETASGLKNDGLQLSLWEKRQLERIEDQDDLKAIIEADAFKGTDHANCLIQ